MKTITVRQMRQNPTQMLRDVEDGETYVVTSHNRPVAHIVPPTAASRIVPPVRPGKSNVSALPPHRLRTASSMEELLEDMKGDW